MLHAIPISTLLIWALSFWWTVQIHEVQHHTLCPSSRPCVTFGNTTVFYGELSAHAQLRNWTTILCELSTYYTYSVEQTPWETNSPSAGQQSFHILWNLKVHYHIHNSPTLVPTSATYIPTTTSTPISLK